MSVDFGMVTIPAHYRQIPNMDFDALLPHLRTRIFHDEWNVPETWPGEITALVNDVMYATPTLIDRLPNLKVISFAGTGVWDRVDVAYATRRGIAVCNVPGWGNDTIAEFTFALLLALARKLFAADAVARRPEWKVEECYGVQLRGKTIGLIGLETAASGSPKSPKASASGCSAIRAARTRRAGPGPGSSSFRSTNSCGAPTFSACTRCSRTRRAA